MHHKNKGVGRKFSRGGGRATEKKTENLQKKTKIALFSLFQGGGWGRGNGKKT